MGEVIWYTFPHKLLHLMMRLMRKLTFGHGMIAGLLVATTVACQSVNTDSKAQESQGQQSEQLRIETPRPLPSGPKGPPNILAPPGSWPAIHVSSTELTLDEPLEIVGNGFQPGKKVSLLLYMGDNVNTFVGGGATAQATADDEGQFIVHFDKIGGTAEVRATAPGSRAILARGSDGSRSSVPVQILSSTAPPDTSVAQYADRYGRALPMEDVADILATGVIQVLLDTDQGIEDIQKCVAINPIWLSRPNGAEMPENLLDGILEAIANVLDMPVFESDFESADSRCALESTQHISFERFLLGGLSQGRLTVELRERFAGTWGGSDWEYTFQKEDGKWGLIESKNTGAS